MKRTTTYTAEDIRHEMPDDFELVPASDYDALAAELEAVKGTDHYQRSLDEMHLRYNMEADFEAVKAERDALAAKLKEYERDLKVNTFEDTEPSVAVHFFPSSNWLREGSGMTSDCMYVSKKDFDRYVFDSKCWHRAYNDRINALAAELARVKAESLRVVPDGGPMTKKQTDGNDPLILGSDNELYNQRLSDEIYLMRISGNPAWAELEDDTIVQPVRLERWEESSHE